MVLIRPTVLPTPTAASEAAKAVQKEMPGLRQAEDDVRNDERKEVEQEMKRERREGLDHSTTNTPGVFDLPMQ
jgi:uncharacterized membrane protein